LVFSVGNFFLFFHNLYIFALVDWAGIYYPQLFMLIVGVLVLVLMKKSYLNLSNYTIDSWKVSEKFFKIKEA